MTELQRYLAEEIAGIMPTGSSRGAKRCVAATARVDQRDGRIVARGHRGRGGGGAADSGDRVPRPAGPEAHGAWADASRPRGGVLVIHENRGLNDSIRTIAGRLAASGYSALAIDLLSEEGGAGSFSDEFEASWFGTHVAT